MNANPHGIRLSKASSQFAGKLGRHHFSHLRAIAEGVTVIESAKRYLAVDHGNQAKSAHQQVVDAIRAVARRHHESAWRLIGLSIRVEVNTKHPSLDEFIAERDLDGWSESEIAEMYTEEYPPASAADYKSNRRTKLRERQLALLKKLEQLFAETPSPKDLVAGWFDDVTANKICNAGMLTLGDLNRKVSAGGRWYSTLPGIGQEKARRIATHLATLLPRETLSAKPVFALSTTPSLFAPLPNSQPHGVSQRPREATLPPSKRLLNASNDVEAIDAWIDARARSEVTRKAYMQQARRLLLWLQYEREGKTLVQMQIEDCLDYMTFLQHIPEKWISRQHAPREQPGWAPFRGQLKHKSQQQAVNIITGLFSWLLNTMYIPGNPWVQVNKDTGDDRQERMLDTKAFSEAAFAEVLEFIKSQPPSPSRSRIRFILRFVEAVGLRSQELLNATLGDIRLEPEGWMLQVHGKGSKNRLAAIPRQAFDALQDYLESRNLGGIETAPPHAPLLASTLDPMEPVGYQALYEHVKSWISKAVAASALPLNERSRLAGATTHWLRHTFGTRAVAREVPLDVIQAQMGHASIQTTMGIYGRAPMKRRSEELAKAFG